MKWTVSLDNGSRQSVVSNLISIRHNRKLVECYGHMASWKILLYPQHVRKKPHGSSTIFYIYTSFHKVCLGMFGVYVGLL